MCSASRWGRRLQKEYRVRKERVVLVGYCVKSECTIGVLREALCKHGPNYQLVQNLCGKEGSEQGFHVLSECLTQGERVFTMLELESFHHPREGPGGTSGESPAQFHPWSIPDRMMQGYSCHGWQDQSRWIGVCGL